MEKRVKIMWEGRQCGREGEEKDEAGVNRKKRWEWDKVRLQTRLDGEEG